MSGNPIIFESDLEGSVSLSSKKGMESELHSSPSVNAVLNKESSYSLMIQRWKHR